MGRCYQGGRRGVGGGLRFSSYARSKPLLLGSRKQPRTLTRSEVLLLFCFLAGQDLFLQMTNDSIQIALNMAQVES